ncbi:hypothetical protein ACGFNU_11320 [Spirillospora sp. NPDC048911]|uniref:hypothetical protein n=1 Tax=Spirillospora sp. NPDC048911 TaxID=3364527 RepID=UPI0037123A10
MIFSRESKPIPVVDVAEISDPAELTRELGRERELAAARRDDELARLRGEAGHARARADVAENGRQAELARAEREAEAAAAAELARMHRQFQSAGERIRIKSVMSRSGEARALRLERLRSLNIKVLVPLLIGFGVWSTTGVQQGAARLMAVPAHSPVWWVLWGLEALLIGTVCWIIVVRARLAASGGELSDSAEKIGVACLTVSIFLNLIAAVPTNGLPTSGWWAIPGSMFAHALGPVGAAVIAHLIGLIDKSISDADPWHDKGGREVPRLAAMDLRPTTSATATSTPASNPNADVEGASESAEEPFAVVWPIRSGERSTLPIIARPATAKAAEAAPRTGDDRQGEPDTKAPREPHPKARRPRPNKGVPVPESAKPAPRPLTDDDHLERLVKAIDKGDVPEDASIRQVQTGLGLGFDRARRVRDLYRERLAELDRQITESARPGLAVVGGERR